MFNPFQVLSQARQIKKELDNVQVTGVSSNQKIKITLNGNHELISVETREPNEFQNKKELEKELHEALESALSQLKQKMVETLQGKMPM